MSSARRNTDGGVSVALPGGVAARPALKQPGRPLRQRLAMLADVVARGLVPPSRVDRAATNDRVEALRLGRLADRHDGDVQTGRRQPFGYGLADFGGGTHPRRVGHQHPGRPVQPHGGSVTTGDHPAAGQLHARQPDEYAARAGSPRLRDLAVPEAAELLLGQQL